jgi:hypothetical protein
VSVNLIGPNFSTRNRLPAIGMTPIWHDPLSAGFVLGAAFFATELAGVDVAGAFVADGDWAHPATGKHDTKMAAAAKLRSMA